MGYQPPGEGSRSHGGVVVAFGHNLSYYYFFNVNMVTFLLL